MSTDSKTFIAELQQQLNANTQRVREVLSGLKVAHLNWRPDAKTWSVGQVVQHLITTEKAYADNVAAALKAAEQRTRQAKKTLPAPRHTRMGKLMIWGSKPGSKLHVPVPSVFAPGDAVDENILEDFLLSQAELSAQLQRASGLDLSHDKLKSPVTGLVRLNLADALKLQVAHQQRHVDQMVRIRKMPGFGR